MREIEIKVRVAALEPVIATLTEQGATVSEPVTQHDVVYGRDGEDGEGDNTAPWLRVRTETRGSQTRTLFTLKKSVTNQMDSIEHETVVEDATELGKIITHLDFRLYSDLTKTRQTAHMGKVEICLDYIHDLGYFVEVERLVADDANYDAVAAELWQVLTVLGATKADEVTDGYDVLMNKHLEGRA